MIVFDASVLLLLLNPETPPPNDAATGQPVTRCKDRIEYFIAQLTQQREKIIIPTPALSESLIKAGDAAPQYLDIMRNSRFFQVSPFGPTAAVEAAELMRKRIARLGTLKGDALDSRAKVKFDLQIVAIARVTRATKIFTDDEGLQKLAKSYFIAADGIASLPLPPEDAQTELDFTPPSEP
ncbi:MAG: type II toxin-antitoxin system VapC family toxin [Hyphomicrobiaceae bacterium]